MKCGKNTKLIENIADIFLAFRSFYFIFGYIFFEDPNAYNKEKMKYDLLKMI